MFLNKKGIKHTVNVPYTPEQNGVSERENRTILEAARSMLHSNSDLPTFLWAEAMNTAVHVINRTGPTRNGNKTPFELWFNKVPNIDNLKVFGTECFYHVPKEKRRKLDKKSEKGYLVGYLENCKGYRVYVPNKKDVILSRDVLFKPEKVAAEMTDITCFKTDNKSEIIPVENVVDTSKNDAIQNINEVPLQSSIDNNTEKRQLRDRSKIRQTDFYGCPITCLSQKLPSTYKEAMKSKDKDNWKVAMQDEMDSLNENGTWLLVQKPENQKVIDSRWVFTKKLSHDSSERYKARLVIKGYSQKQGIDYTETFSPVVRFDTVRFLLSVAAKENLFLGQFDVKTAFLYGNLQENIYMKQPEGFEDGSSRVCKLIKSLYGLKQAPRCWTEHFTNFLRGLGFTQSIADPCLYIHFENNKRILLTIYVDDGLIAASNEFLIDKLLEDLSKQFTITSTKRVTNFLGIEIFRKQDGSIFIHQSNYIKKILDKFNMTDANSVSTPIECNYDDNVCEKLDCNAPFREAVGNLMFLQIVTRPDISFAVNVISRELEKPSEHHWMLVKRIFRYLKGTMNMGILYCKNGIWLKKLFNDCKIEIDNYVLFVDNISAIKLIKNPEIHQRSKHIDVKYHFIRDSFEKGEIDVKYVRSEEQVADIFTKALAKPRFIYLREKLGIKDKNEIQ